MNQLNAEHLNALLNVPLCRELNEEELKLLISHSKILYFASGDTVIHQGSKGEGMYIVIKGTGIAAAKILGEGITHIATVGPGEILGEISLIEEGLAGTSMIANSDMECILVTNAYFSILSLVYPHTKYKIMGAIAQQVAQRIKAMHHKITTFVRNTEMIQRSIFSEVMKSLTTTTHLQFEKNTLNLKQFSFPASLNKKEINQLLDYGNFLEAPRGCLLIHEAAKNSDCYLVLRGAVQSSIVQDNKVVKLSVISPGILFGSVNIIDANSAAIINYTTCERAILFKINENNQKKMIDENLMLWRTIFYLVCKSLVAIEHSLDKLDIRLHIETYNR